MTRGAARRRIAKGIVVLVTCPGAPVARRLAARLVQQRLAACVSVLPGVTSLFRWQGAVERATEVLLVIKTTPGRFEPMRRAILRSHPYDVPEIIALPITAGHPPYLRWLAESAS